jgi:intergrase/recombinase
VLKALVCLSKYLGVYEEFTKDFKNHGIKWINGDSFSGFLHIINDNHSDLVTWLRDTSKVLADNERLFLRFALVTGLRKTEAVMSFNKIIEMSKANKLNEYYNAEISTLEHFKYPKQFLRNTKNCYVSVCNRNLITEICNSKPISYSTLRKHLKNHGIKLRIKELRSYNNSYLRKNGILSEFIDILAGRIPKSVFVRHYLKESLSNLSGQVLPLQLKMLKDIE